MSEGADILEDNIVEFSPKLLDTLLKDHTLSTDACQHNIFWGTHDYENLGKGYGYDDPITSQLIIGQHGKTIMPRTLKNKATQSARIRGMAEVFTPSWICNAQNNLIDNAWFGQKNIFNTEQITEDGLHTWESNPTKIEFPEGKTWKDYVRDVRLEITCGEAPYIVSRYDTTTGEYIPLSNRIGLLDRKLRIISENTSTSREWLKAAQEAYKSIYAYEWQGDNLLLARESMLISFIEYYEAKFKKKPQLKSIQYIAYIISWNIWQMDGIKGVIPNSCAPRLKIDNCVFEERKSFISCEGCKTNNIRKHNGIYCQIKDWHSKDKTTGKLGKRIRFIDLLK